MAHGVKIVVILPPPPLSRARVRVASKPDDRTHISFGPTSEKHTSTSIFVCLVHTGHLGTYVVPLFRVLEACVNVFSLLLAPYLHLPVLLYDEHILHVE